MAYIDPDGLFNGDRIASLSDEAKLFWPYFWCASNTVGRIELNYRKVCNRAFGQFKKPPSEEKFWKWVEEYRNTFLLFTYKSRGQVWGQWSVSERYLPKHKLALDSKTPAPDGKEFEAWKDLYVSEKENRVSSKPIISTNSARLEKVATERIGSGSGSGSGSGEDKNKTFPADAGKEPSKLAVVTGTPVPPIEEQLADTYARRIYDRHPKRRRDIGGEAIRKALITILKTVPKPERALLAQRVDHNHEGWCESFDWTKNDGEYAKGLSNWLAPTMGRWDLEPPARASPRFEPPEETTAQRRAREAAVLEQLRERGVV